MTADQKSLSAALQISLSSRNSCTGRDVIGLVLNVSGLLWKFLKFKNFDQPLNQEADQKGNPVRSNLPNRSSLNPGGIVPKSRGISLNRLLLLALPPGNQVKNGQTMFTIDMNGA